ncbi:MAG: transporter, partial [Legionellales bacterium RIFCSPHIGHO2_12_FULL_35_11]
YILAIISGIICGVSDIPLLKTIGLTVADVFIRIFKCISLPIIFLSIIVTLSNYCSEGVLKIVWRKTMIYTLGTTIIAAALSFILYNLINPSMIGKSTQATDFHLSSNQTSYLHYISGLFPDSIISPFLNNSVISVLFLGIVIGVAIRFIPDEKPKATITQFFHGAHGLFMVVTKWIIKIIPLGLFGFITTTAAELENGGDLKGIWQYLLVIVLANLVQGFIILPLWLKFKGIQPYSSLKKMLPALSLAFVSKSSVGTLPVTISTAEKNLNINPEISRFVLPLCTSINMNGCAAFIFTTVVYLMQNNHIHLSLAAMGLWIIIATVAAIGNAGIPMGCFFLSASLLASMNVPITLLGIILPFYSLIDMLETALNVWSDSCVVKVVNDEVSELAANVTVPLNSSEI